jgi:hypothetical protein
MNSSNARFMVQQIEALAGALHRALESLGRSLDGGPATPTEVARLALADAEALCARVRFLRRRVEEVVPGDVAVDA